MDSANMPMLSTIFNISHLCISSITSLSILFVLYQFILNFTKLTAKRASEFCIGLFFIVNTFIFLCLWSFSILSNYLPHKPYEFHHINILLAILYILQYYSLSFSLFARLRNTFSNSGYLKLSVKTVRVFYCVFVCSLIAFLSFCITIETRMRGTVFWIFAIGFTACFVITLILTINLSFICKLIKIYKFNASNVQIMRIITKTITLTFISTLVTILSLIFIIYRFAINAAFISVYIALCSDLLITFDIYTNFLCIVLPFNYFNKLYNILCGCTHSKCEHIWKSVVIPTESDENELQYPNGRELQMAKQNRAKSSENKSLAKIYSRSESLIKQQPVQKVTAIKQRSHSMSAPTTHNFRKKNNKITAIDISILPPIASSRTPTLCTQHNGPNGHHLNMHIRINAPNTMNLSAAAATPVSNKYHSPNSLAVSPVNFSTKCVSPISLRYMTPIHGYDKYPFPAEFDPMDPEMFYFERSPNPNHARNKENGKHVPSQLNKPKLKLNVSINARFQLDFALELTNSINEFEEDKMAKIKKRTKSKQKRGKKIKKSVVSF